MIHFGRCCALAVAVVAMSACGDGLKDAKVVELELTYVDPSTGQAQTLSEAIDSTDRVVGGTIEWDGDAFTASEQFGGAGTYNSTHIGGQLAGGGERLTHLELAHSGGGAAAFHALLAIELVDLTLRADEGSLPVVFSGPLDLSKSVARFQEVDDNCYNPNCPLLDRPIAGPAFVRVTFR